MPDFYKWWDDYTEEQMKLARRASTRSLIYIWTAVAFSILPVVLELTVGRDVLVKALCDMGWLISLLAYITWNAIESRHSGKVHGAILTMKKLMEEAQKLSTR